MKTAGIICEYNPFHTGHARHIEETRERLGADAAIVCVMSGNFVQRGDFAVFRKHARAETAVRCGADLVVELPAPYALQSAEKFAAAGVSILDSLGVCDYISFGSESGDIEALREAAGVIVSAQADTLIKEWAGKGLAYAAARQKAADSLLGKRAEVFLSPNNLLGIEYLKALAAAGSSLSPLTIKRTGAAHDSETGCSASALRKMLAGIQGVSGSGAYERSGTHRDTVPLSSLLPGSVPKVAAMVYMEEIAAGRGPVTMKACESAMLSRLRIFSDFTNLADASEGLGCRFARYARSEPAIEKILAKVKTKRYAMSRLRRMMVCACLGITAKDTAEPPPYIRILAMNRTGMRLIKAAREKTQTPIITKPASAHKLSGRAEYIFSMEAAATDFYTLAYQNENERGGSQEWRISPVVSGKHTGDQDGVWTAPGSNQPR